MTILEPGFLSMKQFTELSTEIGMWFPQNFDLLAAVFLVFSLVHVPIGGVCADNLTQTAPTRAAEARQLVAQAEAGDPWAQLNLGAAFDHGMGGFPLDPVRAVTWYRRAAETGLAQAQFNLAHCLATGNGVTRNDAEALEWMLRAAEQDLASAQYLAGVMLAEGMGASADRERAMTWLQRAADNGNLDAAAMHKSLLGGARSDGDRGGAPD
jgi:hypothetical protein